MMMRLVNLNDNRSQQDAQMFSNIAWLAGEIGIITQRSLEYKERIQTLTTDSESHRAEFWKLKESYERLIRQHAVRNIEEPQIISSTDIIVDEVLLNN